MVILIIEWFKEIKKIVEFYLQRLATVKVFLNSYLEMNFHGRFQTRSVPRPTETISIIGIVKNLSTLSTDSDIVVNFSELHKNLLSGFIRRSDESEITFHISVFKAIRLHSYKVFILDNAGNWLDCGQDDERQGYGTRFVFPLTVNFTTLVKKKQSYLYNDMIGLKLEMNYLTQGNMMVGKIPSSEKEGIPYFHVPEKEKKRKKAPPTLADDLLSLYKEGTLCDTKLCTDSETFPAHKSVLSARSPVFKKMFTNGMKETTGDSVDIPDVSANTMRRLLMFIYTDAVDGMTWQNAVELYASADKYQIDSLKSKCSSFFELNVRPSNCSDLLLLSDMHQDADLKQFVQGYIVTRDEEVFASEEWRVFMSNHVQLAADTMYLKYARK